MNKPVVSLCPWVRLFALVICLLLVTGTFAAQSDLRSPNPAARRMALIETAARGPQAIPELTTALEDSEPLVRRCAVLCLGRFENGVLPALTTALKSPDFMVRRNAALVLGGYGPHAVVPLAEALDDEHPLVRQGAVYALAAIRPRSPAVLDLLTAAVKDEDAAVQQAAVSATDQYLAVVAEMMVPRDGWKFKLDPDRVGKDAGWFKLDLDDSGWDDIGIEKAWGHFGYDYIGTAWYRRTITLPDNPGGTNALIRFGGVDECAWVWVNGEYAGEHDIGPSGWDKPFRLDVTGLLKWGQDNQITVCAMNTAMAGGIWQPITIFATGPAD